MTLHEILSVKGSEVHTIDELSTLDDAVQKLVRHNCGSLVVLNRATDSGRRRMIGILTERDILRACAARWPLAHTAISEAMTRDVIVGAPSDSIEDTMEVMTERRVRHLPILEHGDLVGLISIGDVVKARHEQTVFENHHLKAYLQS
ncbi:MAG TPA: CBS domain-containing protein [Pirellulales bacterium]|jgi:CBS domain-containing protein